MDLNYQLDDWDSFEWPSWVPIQVREQIEKFWDPRIGRSPKEWHLYTVGDRYHGQPEMGTQVRCKDIFNEHTYEGRWVPAWNNIGRVVLSDGSCEVSSMGGLVVIDPRARDKK